MRNATLDPFRDTSNMKDALAYWLVRKLGDVQEFIHEHVISDPVWRSFDGTVHTVSTMTSRHLYNAMQLCMREGQVNNTIFRSMQREYQRRETAHAARQVEVDAARNAMLAEHQQRCKEQRDATPSGMPLPAGWADQSRSTESRYYKHMDGAKVHLGAEGRWLWFKANLHHVRCNDPKDTVWAAMEAALQS